MPADDKAPPATDLYDPVFLHSRREAIVIFVVWIVALLWVVPYCYFFGYVGRVDVNSIPTTLGVPSWLFWGVAVPWLVADVVTAWICFFYMRDDDLGAASDEDSDAAQTTGTGREH